MFTLSTKSDKLISFPFNWEKIRTLSLCLSINLLWIVFLSSDYLIDFSLRPLFFVVFDFLKKKQYWFHIFAYLFFSNNYVWYSVEKKFYVVLPNLYSIQYVLTETIHFILWLVKQIYCFELISVNSSICVTEKLFFPEFRRIPKTFSNFTCNHHTILHSMLEFMSLSRKVPL